MMRDREVKEKYRLVSAKISWGILKYYVKERYAIQNVCKTKKVTAFFFCYSRVYKPYTFLNGLEESFSDQ